MKAPRRWTGCLSLTLCVVLAAMTSTQAGGPPGFTFDKDRGLWTGQLPSEHNATPSQLEIMLPEPLEAGRKYPVLYLLPVGKRGGEYGDAMVEAKKADLANKLGVICVEPTFSSSPWLGNHATDPGIQQDDFMVKSLVPFIDANLPVLAKPEGRWLMGFSKSGWGAMTLILRHPDVFGYAAVWDAPLMLDGSKADWGPMGLKRNFGTKEKMLEFLPTTLVKQKGAQLGDKPRIVLAPGQAWTPQVKGFRTLLDQLKIPYVYRDDLISKHRWDSGWFEPMAVELAKIAKPAAE